MERADIALTHLGLAKSRTQAKEIILENRAFCNGKLINKPSLLVDVEKVTIEHNYKDSYVSRGALKLKKAIESFNINLNNLVCMDIGASTGGFTQIMLNNGAKKVYAIDVGTEQLVDSLRRDDRVVVMENTNFRYLDSSTITGKVDFVSIDVSFISLKYIFENLINFINQNTKIVALIKPQFECEGKSINKKGVVKSEKILLDVIEKIRIYAITYNLEIKSIVDSPIRGGDGNKEFLALIELNLGREYEKI